MFRQPRQLRAATASLAPFTPYLSLLFSLDGRNDHAEFEFSESLLQEILLVPDNARVLDMNEPK